MVQQPRGRIYEGLLEGILVLRAPPGGLRLHHALERLAGHGLGQSVPGHGEADARGLALGDHRGQHGGGEEPKGQRRVQAAPSLRGQRRGRRAHGLPSPAESQVPELGVREAPEVRVNAYSEMHRRLGAIAFPRRAHVHCVGFVGEPCGDVEHLPRLHDRVEKQVLGRRAEVIRALAASKGVQGRGLRGRWRPVDAPALPARGLDEEHILLVRVALRAALKPRLGEVAVEPDGQPRRLEHGQGHIRELGHQKPRVQEHHRGPVHGRVHVTKGEPLRHGLVVDATLVLHAMGDKVRGQALDIVLHILHGVAAHRKAPLFRELEGPGRPAVLEERPRCQEGPKGLAPGATGKVRECERLCQVKTGQLPGRRC
mmetsp:Transcript_2834/g.8105  ORF Transcript_2834/g.8105 Transcript_2834/m.8105 type:complete len:370 (+) Transcript_2834:283-1392(+)